MSARTSLLATALAALFALAPLAQAAPQRRGGDVVPGRYIVVLRASVDDVGAAIIRREKRDGFKASLRYGSAIKGFAAKLGRQQLSALRADPNVALVVPDRTVRAVGAVPLAGGEPVPQPGVRRIRASTTTTTRPASTANVAVIDTGVQSSHPDLVVSAGRNCVGGSSTNDDNGHGTHVAGIIGARNNGSGVVGVAPGTRIYAVKVLNYRGSGTTSQVICGIDWVTANASALGIKVANMSLSGGGPALGSCPLPSDAEHRAICRSVAAGVTYVVAAGNSGWDFDYAPQPDVPAAYPDVLTATAMTDTNGTGGGGGAACGAESDDVRASYSNYAATAAGAAHTIAGPGTCVRSTWTGSSYRSISGTSMASPHVAGAVALCLGEGGVAGPCAGMTPAQIIQKLRSDAEAATQADSAFGFNGDPLRPFAGRTYGFLVNAQGGPPPPPPPAPFATTGAASSVTATGATLGGTVDARGAPTQFRFEYGTSPTSLTSSTPLASAGSGNGAVPVSAAISGLASETTYYFRVVGINAGGTTPGATESFQTAEAPPVTARTANPGAVTIETGTARSGSAASLAAADSDLYSVNATRSFFTNTVAWYGRFTGVPATLANLRVTYQGRNSASCTQTVAIFRWSDSAWVTLDSRSVGTTDVLVTGLAPAGAPSAYDSSGGELRVRVRCTNSSFSALFSSGNWMQIAYDA
jgi:subtilisin family serine protease